MIKKIYLLIVIAVISLLGCGGESDASVTAATAPSISIQPLSLTVNTGATVALSVSATGTSPLTYQWYKNGTAIAGGTNASFTISPVSSSDAASYTVKVTNSAGSVTSAAAVLTVVSTSSSQTSNVVIAAQTFQSTLTASQQAGLLLPWNVDTARRWSNLPAAMVTRNGIAWGSLTTSQKTAARSLILTALGTTGNSLHEGMQFADDALVAIYGANSAYGNGNYYIAFIGSPSTSDFWMLQLTGHHLTFNLAFNGSYKSVTPMFLGVEPKGAFSLNGTTYDPMSTQREAIAALGALLPTYSGAKLAGTYSDLIYGANGAGGIDGICPRNYASITDHGLPYNDLSTAEKQLVQTAIKSYVNTQSSEFSQEFLNAYLADAALAQTYVAYSGNGNVSTNGNYFRIEGPRVWIEFSVQRSIVVSSDIHYHTIWRDKLADYGGKCQAS
jgi:hypothetical protein